MDNNNLMREQIAAVHKRLIARRETMASTESRFLADCLIILIRSLGGEQVGPGTRLGETALVDGAKITADGGFAGLSHPGAADHPHTTQVNGILMVRGERLPGGGYQYHPADQQMQQVTPAQQIGVQQTQALEDVSANLRRAQGGPPPAPMPVGMPQPVPGSMAHAAMATGDGAAGPPQMTPEKLAKLRDMLSPEEMAELGLGE